MTSAGRAGLPAAAVAALGLCASAPPAWFPGAEFLVLVGLGALYLVATRSNRPYRWGYAVGLVHVLWFSWSLRHVTGPGYVAIGAAGAVYFVLAVAWTRAFARFGLAPLGFGLGIAATAWLRSSLPEIWYPHVQPAHALYSWPALLGAVRWGGEVLMNVLVAAVAAGLADAVTAVRRRSGLRWAVGTGAVAAGLALVSPAVDGPAGGPESIRVAALQSDFPIRFERTLDGYYELRSETARVAAESPGIELFLWPESTCPPLEGDPPRFEGRFRPAIPADAVLCAGSMWNADDGRRAVAVVVDAGGRLVDFHEKRVSVPGGERVPFVAWLPDGLRESALDLFEGIIGFRPDQLHGRRRPPLSTPSGVPFAAMTCFDNAFSWVAREAVEDGARLLAVISNETWYQQGAELDQMVAMTVLRALETATPVVRSTVDGATCVVDAAGRIDAILPRNPGSGPVALVHEVRLGPGRASAIAWILPGIVGLCLLSALLVAAHLAGAFRARRRPGTENDQDRALDPT